MIKLLERYIAKTIIAATGLIALVIAALLFLMLLLGELKNIGEGDYNLPQAIFFVLLRLPNELYQFAPMFILLGSMIGLSILSSHRELAVMRSSGFAIRQIIYSVLSAALLLILVISTVGELIGPNLSYRAEVHKENAQNAGEAVVTSAGIWFHVGNNFIHVQRIVGRQFLEGVTRYQFDDEHHLQAAYFAKTLAFQDNRWQMGSVAKTSFYNDRTFSQSFASLPWDLKFNPNLLNEGLVEPSDMSLPKLAKFANYLRQNGLQSSEYQFNFWQRIFQPLSSLVMIFLSIPFILGILSHTTIGWRILVGIMLGFTFFILNAVLGQLCIVFQIPPLLAALLPPLIFIIVGAVLTKKMVKN